MIFFLGQVLIQSMASLPYDDPPCLAVLPVVVYGLAGGPGGAVREAWVIAEWFSRPANLHAARCKQKGEQKREGDDCLFHGWGSL